MLKSRQVAAEGDDDTADEGEEAKKEDRGMGGEEVSQDSQSEWETDSDASDEPASVPATSGHGKHSSCCRKGWTLPVSKAWFVTKKLKLPKLPYELHRTREIHEKEANEGIAANSYFIKGEKADLIIDTGYGLLSLYDHLVSMGLLAPTSTRPLYIVGTHEHFDHVGGMRHFAGHPGVSIMMGHLDADAVTSGNVCRTCADEVRYYALKPAKYWKAAPYEYDSFLATLKNYTVQADITHRLASGDEIDVGGAVFRVVELPGHTPGSIGLYNPSSGELYTGDAMYEACGKWPLLDTLPDSDVDAYDATMERILALKPTIVLGGHWDPLKPKEIEKIAKGYIAGKFSAAKKKKGKRSAAKKK